MAKKWTAADVNALMREESYKSLKEIQKRNESATKVSQNSTISNKKQQPANKTRVAEKKKNQIPALDVEKLLSVDYKMSKDERKDARKYAKQEMKEYGKKIRSGEISQEQAAKDLLDVNSDYYKLQALYNKSNPLSAFSTGVLESMPGTDALVNKSAEKGNVTAQLFKKAEEDARVQNKVALGAGNLAGNAAKYSALSPLLQKVPGLNAVTGKAAEQLSKIPVLSKVGAAPIQNVLNDMAVDLALDTSFSVARDVRDDKNAGEIAKNTALNIGGNLAANILGEAAPALFKSIMDKRSNGITKVAENSLEQATEDVTKKVDDVIDSEKPEISTANKTDADLKPEKTANVKNKPQSKLKNLESSMKKIVDWYGDDATKAEFLEFQNALKQFEETGSMDDFRRVWESADRLDQSMKGKTYTTKDVLNKNGSLKRKGVTYTYGENASVEIAMEDAMDALDELYTLKNTPKVEGNNSPIQTNEIPYLRTEGTGKLKEESYGGNIGKGRIENVDETVQNQFIDNPQLYKELSNKETVEKAQQIYDAGNAEGQIYRLLDLKDPASIPLGNRIVGDMIDQGRHDDAVQLLRVMSSKLRESGQFTQAAAINMMKSDPETALRYAVREIDNLNSAGAQKYKGKWKDFALTEDEIKEFKNIKSGDEDAIKAMYEKIGARIAKDYPSTMWEKFTELSRISMLLNPRTNIRNVISNAMMQPIRSLTDRVSALGQNAIHLINPDFKVTQSLVGGGKEEKKLATEVWDSVKDSLLDGTSRFDNGLKGIEREKQVFKGGLASKSFDKLFPGAIEKANKAMGKNVDDSLLETARNFTYYLLEKGDEPFFRNSFVNRLASYMKAQGIKNIDEIPADAITLAKDEALKATFKDDNKFTSRLSGIKKNLGKGGEVILPFTKTPANLAMRGIDYSPAGLSNTFKQIKNGADAGKVMDDLSKNLTGTAAIYLGYLLAKNGIITGALSSDKDEAAFQKQQGQLAYAIKVGDNYYNYDWAQPAAIPIILGATIEQSIAEMDDQEKSAVEKLQEIGNIVQQATTSAADTWVELSPLQTVSDLFNTGYGNGIAENVVNEFLEFPQRLIPAVLGATARTIDTTQRQTYSAENPLKTQIDTAKSKIPFLSKTLPAAYDTWGNEIKRSDNIGEAAIAQYINPGQLGNSAETPIDSEIQRLYDNTENKAVFPQKSAWTVDGKKLDNKQYSDLQKAQGAYSYDLANAIIGDSNYKKMDDSEKADLLSSAYSFAKSMAENKVVGKSIPKAREKEVEIYKEQGVPGLASWYVLKQSADTDGNSSITQEEAKIALDNSNLSNLQKAYFWQMFNSSWKSDKNPYK